MPPIEIKPAPVGSIRAALMDHLMNNGMFENDADQIVADYLTVHAEVMRGRIDHQAAGYPRAVVTLAIVGVNDAAIKWIEANAPGHWAKAMFV